MRSEERIDAAEQLLLGRHRSICLRRRSSRPLPDLARYLMSGLRRQLAES